MLNFKIQGTKCPPAPLLTPMIQRRTGRSCSRGMLGGSRPRQNSLWRTIKSTTTDLV